MCIRDRGLRGGVIYHDGQFDDTRMAISLALTANDQNACLINYCEVIGLIKKNNLVTGLEFKDTIKNQTYEIKAKVVINATGVFVTHIIKQSSFCFLISLYDFNSLAPIFFNLFIGFLFL